MSFSTFKNFTTFVCLSTVLLGATSPAQAEDLAATTSAPLAEDASWWNQAKSKTKHILDDGSLSMMLSGLARHGRNTYTPERIDELNEKAWGLGFSKAIRTSKDNEESLYGVVISDSHFSQQFMAGYAYQWMRPLGNKYEAGLGVTALLISRKDYFSGLPFPGFLPVASIGTRHTKLMASYIPRISQNKGNGDVLLLFVRFDLN